MYEITPKEKISTGLKDLWQYRELLFMLAFRDFKVRYAQTFIGILWAFIQPFITLLIFIIVFSKALKINTGSIPYPVFALSGMLAWNYFSYIIAQAGNSIIGAQSIVTKIYFPRLIIPLSKSFVGLIDFSITLLLMLGVMAYYHYIPSLNTIFLPFFIIILLLLSSAVGILISALSIRFRDIQYIIPFLVQIGMYITPVAYPVSIVPEKYRLLYYFNPMAGIIDGFRWCLTGSPLQSNVFAFSVIFTLVLLVCSIYYFQKVERVIADII